MLKFFRKKSKAAQAAPKDLPESHELTHKDPTEKASADQANMNLIAQQTNNPRDSTPTVSEEVEAKPKHSLFQRLKQSLVKTRHVFTDSLANLLLGKKILDEDLLEELETLLLVGDLGVEVTQNLIETIHQQISRKSLQDPQKVYHFLQTELLKLLTPCQAPLSLTPKQKPYMILMVGVNGAGKTTTIGKLAKKFQQAGQSVLLAAGDTFRAAAVEQLKIWGDRNNVPVVAQHTGSDSASVIYDALNSALAKNIDVVIADTAGRLHTRDNLMEELKKIIRVTQKLIPDAPHEIMLVLDATTGQNALQQARIFHQLVHLNSITMTKLDGTAKGGILFAIAHELKLPIRFMGIGEGIDDLRTFDANDFVKALFASDSPELTT